MFEKIEGYNPNFRQVICKNIKRYRHKKNIRLMDLAEILDISPEYLKRIKTPNDPRKNCSLKMFYKISLVFNKKMDDFLIEYTSDDR